MSFLANPTKPTPQRPYYTRHIIHVVSYTHTFTSTWLYLSHSGNKYLDASFHLSSKRSLQATTVVAETTVVADIGGLTIFSAIDFVPCSSQTFVAGSQDKFVCLIVFQCGL